MDLRDVEARYGFPYMVIHRSDLHGTFLRACQAAGATLVNNKKAERFENTADGALVTFADGSQVEAPIVIAADGAVLEGPPAGGAGRAGELGIRRLPPRRADRAGGQQ